MEREIIIDGNQFSILDVGGHGSCLFKCLAMLLNMHYHEVRQEIVNYVIRNWTEYHEEVLHILDINNPQTYKKIMRKRSTYGSLLECHAAVNLYNINLTIIRATQNNSFFLWPFEKPGSDRSFYLLFTGNYTEVSQDGHFQILFPHSQEALNTITNWKDSDQTESIDNGHNLMNDNRRLIGSKVIVKNIFPTIEEVYKLLRSELPNFPDCRSTVIKKWLDK